MVKYKITKRVKCPKCNYEWNTLSQMKFVSCPSCMSKVNIEEQERK